MKIKLALREIRQNRGFSLAFVTNLSLGLYGFLLLSSLNVSIQESFQDRSRAILTADLSVSSRRAFTEEEDQKITAITASAIASGRAIELYSMVATKPEGSRLSEIVAIEDNYPLYGELKLEKAGRMQSQTPKTIQSQPQVWISPELSVQLKIKTGNTVKLGDLLFQVADQVVEDSGASFRGFSLAPRLYLGLAQLKKTGLIRPGSTLSYRRFFKFASSKTSASNSIFEDDLEKAVVQLNRDLKDPGIQITTHRQAGEQMSRVLTYLSDYLGLVTLVGLFLAALGSAFLFQSFIASRLKEIATLICLGLPSAGAIEVYLFQVLLLGVGGVVLATLATWLTLPLAERILKQYLAFSFHLKLPLLAFLTSLIVGMAVSILMCLPFIFRIRTLRPSLLFQESQTQQLSWNSKAALGFLPAGVFFYLISVWQAHSWRLGSLFAVGMGLSGLFLAVLGVLGLRILDRTRVQSLPAKLALRYLVLNPVSTTAAFMAIGLGAVLINFLPQIQRNIESEIQLPQVSHVPSLFLFDIQEDQISGLKQVTPLMQLSPLVRARLISVAGRPFERSQEDRFLSARPTREEEQETRMRNRGVNLTFRDQLSESETLVAGVPFSGRYQGSPSVPQISVEENYAKTLGAHLGDLLEFDVQGIPVQAQISSLRKVKWTSFQPNFFVEFQPGVLDDAPKTYIAAIEKLSLQDRARVQNLLVEKFPNISVIDVSQVMERLLDLFSQMSWALRVMALFSIATGMVVLFSIARHQALLRRNEIQLLKVLGGDMRLVFTTQAIEFGAVGFFAAVLGVILSLILSWVVSVFIFDSLWSFSFILPVVTVGGILALTGVTIWLAVRSTLKEKPSSLLG